MGGFKRGGGNFESAPEGLHPAVCCDVVYLGEVKKPWSEKLIDTIRLVFALDPSVRNSKGELFYVRRDYTNTLGNKGNLFKDLQSWRGRALTDADLAPFMEEGGPDKMLLGANCQVQIIHKNTDGGNTYANIQAIMPGLKGVAKLMVPSDYTREKDKPTESSASGGGGGWNDETTSYGTGTGATEDDDIPF